jgi:diacylglycerol kinase family enzyme
VETTLERAEELAERLLPDRTPKRRMLVIVNPYATTVSDRLRNLVVYALQSRYAVEAIDTQERNHATLLTREAAREGYDVVVAFGGDGTVNEAANGLLGTQTPLTCLPGGSNNVFCKMLGIPPDVVDATEHLLLMADDWRPRPADLGVANGRRFTFAAGMGLDASVVERVDAHPHLKTRFGVWYFTGAAVQTFLRRYVVRPPQLEVSAGGRTVRGVSVFFQNGSTYTYFKNRPVDLVAGARLDSGDLAGVVLTRANPVDVPTVMFRALSCAARIGRHRRVESLAGIQEATVRSLDGRPVPFQVDGDHVGDAEEVTFSVERGAISIVA